MQVERRAMLREKKRKWLSQVATIGKAKVAAVSKAKVLNTLEL